MTTIDIFRDTEYGARVDPAEKKRREAELIRETKSDVQHELSKRDLHSYPNLIVDGKQPWVDGRTHKDHDKKWPGSYHVSIEDGKPKVELRFHKDQRESPAATKAVAALENKFDVSVVDTPPKTEW